MLLLFTFTFIFKEFPLYIWKIKLDDSFATTVTDGFANSFSQLEHTIEKIIKRNNATFQLISRIINFVCESPQVLPNDFKQDLRKLGNIDKISSLVGGRAQCPVSLSEKRPCSWQLNIRDKQKANYFLILSIFS